MKYRIMIYRKKISAIETLAEVNYYIDAVMFYDFLCNMFNRTHYEAKLSLIRISDNYLLKEYETK